MVSDDAEPQQRCRPRLKSEKPQQLDDEPQHRYEQLDEIGAPNEEGSEAIMGSHMFGCSGNACASARITTCSIEYQRHSTQVGDTQTRALNIEVGAQR